MGAFHHLVKRGRLIGVVGCDLYSGFFGRIQIDQTLGGTYNIYTTNFGSILQSIRQVTAQSLEASQNALKFGLRQRYPKAL